MMIVQMTVSWAMDQEMKSGKVIKVWFSSTWFYFETPKSRCWYLQAIITGWKLIGLVREWQHNTCTEGQKRRIKRENGKQIFKSSNSSGLWNGTLLFLPSNVDSPPHLEYWLALLLNVKINCGRSGTVPTTKTKPQETLTFSSLPSWNSTLRLWGC